MSANDLPNIPGVTWAIAISTDPRATKRDAFNVVNQALRPTPPIAVDQTKQLTDEKVIDLLLEEGELL